MRYLLTIILLASCAAPATAPAPLPAQRVLALVLIVSNERLAQCPVTIEPDTTRVQWWEGGGSHRPIVFADGAVIEIDLILDVLGSYSPYWLAVRIRQDADGTIDVECDEYSQCGSIRTESFTVACYADAAWVILMSGDTLADVLCRLADGHPPLDMTTLSSRLSEEIAAVEPDTRFLIDSLDAPDWYDREAAARLLTRSDRIPQLRMALRTRDLSDEQRRAIECILSVPSSGNAMRDAARRSHL